MVIATGSRVKGIPADRARDQQDHRHQLRRGALPRAGAQDAGHHRRRRGRLRVRRHLQRLRHQGDADRGAAADPAASRTPSRSDALAKSFRKRGITVLAGAKVIKADVRKDSVTLELEAGGKTETVDGREGADGRRPRGEHRGHGLQGGRRAAHRPRLRQGEPRHARDHRARASTASATWPARRCWRTRGAARASSWPS